MKKWIVVIILALAQFVMVLDSTVMNVSISEVVADLDTTVAGLQMAITFYTLTMAAFMLFGGKLGDIWGRLKIFRIGAVIYAVGSLITGLSQNLFTLTVGWSFIEGFGAILIIPAIAALIAANYRGKDRVVAYAIIGGISGAAAAAGPIIGGFITTYLSWRYVFFSEVIIMLVVLLMSHRIADHRVRVLEKIDIRSVLLVASGMSILVFGMLQSKVWGWVTPHAKPELFGKEIAPFDISLVAYFVVIGGMLLWAFFERQKRLEKANKNPLLKPSLFKIQQLRGGLSVLAGQYTIIAALFFAMPIYLQMTLGLDALDTGIKILPLSIALITFSVLGSKAISYAGQKTIVRVGQYALVAGTAIILIAIDPDLKNWAFSVGVFIAGAGLGLLASQLGNINMSAVSEKLTGEVGGLQGTAQNLGSSLGTALIGSILIASLTTAFVANVNQSDLPNDMKAHVQDNSQAGVEVISGPEVVKAAEKKGLSPQESHEIEKLYTESQLSALKQSLFAIVVLAIIAIPFSRNISNKKIHD